PPIPGFPPVGCVMTFSEILQTKIAVLSYDAVIAASAFRHNATVVDIFTLVNNVALRGVDVGNRHITLDSLGGCISLDGMHPTTTGYAIILKDLITTMNRQSGTNTPPVSVEQVVKTDCLVFPNSCPLPLH